MLLTTSQFLRFQRIFILLRRNLQIILRKYHTIPLFIISIAIILSACAYFFQTRFAIMTKGASNKEQRTHNLRALTKLYGYVRYFHPSDEAANVDWERFLLYAIDTIQNAHNDNELKCALEFVFHPIAPTLHIINAPNDSTFTEPPSFHIPPALAPFYPQHVAWQHRGLGGEKTGDIYRSIRTGRNPAARPMFGVIFQMIPAEKMRGKEIRLTGMLKKSLSDINSIAKLRLRVVTPAHAINLDSLSEVANAHHLVMNWRTEEILGRVDSNAKYLVFGASLFGFGELGLDNIRLSMRSNDKEDWKPIEINNADFEKGADSTISGWTKSNLSFSYTLTDKGLSSGSQYLRISKEPTQEMKKLFAAMPDTGKCINKVIYQNDHSTLRCILPLVLPAHDSATYSPQFTRSYNALKGIARYNSLLQQQVQLGTDKDWKVRCANVIMVWNIFQHFYPYFDVVKVDWDEQLTKTLNDIQSYTTTEDFIRTMNIMIAQVRDGHAAFGISPQTNRAMNDGAMRGYLPINVTEVAGQIVVTASFVPEIRPGDIIVKIRDTKGYNYLRLLEQYVSGSPQWQRIRALVMLTEGKRGDMMYCLVQSQGEKNVRTVSLQYTSHTPLLYEGFSHSAVEKIGDDIYYLDMNAITKGEWEPQISAIASAKGVIADFRRYPRDKAQDFLSYCTDKPLYSARWDKPQILYPDHERLIGYDTSGRWIIPPKAPHIQGKIIFLMGPNAISYSESVLGIVEHYKLGEILGEATAGANGNKNEISLPGGFMVSWTGMRVLKHDGTQLHNIGIKPTQEVKRTIEGIKSGKDEVLEAALALIRSK